MKKRPGKNKQTAPKTPKTLALSRTFSPWLALLSVVFAPMVIGTCFAANASNGSSAVKAASARFEQQLHLSDEPQSVKVAHTAAAGIPEVMPEKAKPATTPKEAKQIIAQVGDSNSAITYDPWGRIAKIVEPDSSVRQFVYSGNTLCEERDGTGAVTKKFFNWGEMIGSTKYFYTRDHLGSVVEMTDQSGNIVAQYKYDPWGNVTRIAGSGPDSDFLYAGYFYHKPSGLYITRHRLYSPKLGRWLNRDPIDDPMFAKMQDNPELPATTEISYPSAPVNPNFLAFQSVSKNPMIQAHLARSLSQANPYRYVKNDPISGVDPSGLKADIVYPIECPTCTNDKEMCPANCEIHWRYSQQNQKWQWTILFARGTQVCEAYPYNGWPDTKNGYCTWKCH